MNLENQGKAYSSNKYNISVKKKKNTYSIINIIAELI